MQFPTNILIYAPYHISHGYLYELCICEHEENALEVHPYDLTNSIDILLKFNIG